MKVYELIEALRKMPQDARITIYIVHEIEGGNILAAYGCKEDAKCFLNFGEYDGSLMVGCYKISEVILK